MLDRDSWASTLRELIIKSLLGLWIIAFAASVLSEMIPAYIPLAMASSAMLAFVLFPTNPKTEETEQAADAAQELGSVNEVA